MSWKERIQKQKQTTTKLAAYGTPWFSAPTSYTQTSTKTENSSKAPQQQRQKI